VQKKIHFEIVFTSIYLDYSLGQSKVSTSNSVVFFQSVANVKVLNRIFFN